jgi:NADH-quinone oxidoreductase subunit F
MPPGTSARTSTAPGFDLDVTVHAGAGAYICGEETALLDSLEGRRGQPRLKPPFPGRRSLRPPDRRQQRRVDRLGPGIILEGVDWFKTWAPRSRTGFGIFSLSGHVKNPGQYEAPLGITLRELLDMAGGMRDPSKKP